MPKLKDAFTYASGGAFLAPLLTIESIRSYTTAAERSAAFTDSVLLGGALGLGVYLVLQLFPSAKNERKDSNR